MRKVFGIGETILDIIFRNDQPQKAVPGGSVFNGLISLGRLNVPVSFISELGNDRVGDMIRDFMEDNHITTEFVDRFPDGKSPISLAFLDDDKNANYIFYKDYPAQRLEVPLPKIEKDDIFVFGSYYSLNPVLRTRMVEFLQYAQERKAIIYYDPKSDKYRCIDNLLHMKDHDPRLCAHPVPPWYRLLYCMSAKHITCTLLLNILHILLPAVDAKNSIPEYHHSPDCTKTSAALPSQHPLP